jgi:polyisoprenoid-binding protein YceI
MSMSKLVKGIVLTATLLTGSSLALAEDNDVCSPFRDGKVNSSLLATMLTAAHDGHLYRIQQESSQVGFCVDSKLSRIKGSFREFQGGMALDPGDNDNGQTMVMIQANSLETEGAIVENMVKGEGFFDVEHYPEVLFVSTGFQWTGADTAVLKGNLTLRGITKPVIFNVTLTSLDNKQIDKAQRILVKATTSIDRTDFGMEKLTTLVDGSVKLCMSVEALKYGA